jgi:hypothetical protein
MTPYNSTLAPDKREQCFRVRFEYFSKFSFSKTNAGMTFMVAFSFRHYSFFKTSLENVATS